MAVETADLPACMPPTCDLDGTGTPSFTAVSLFGGLPAGSYRVSVDTAALSPALLPSYDRDGGLDNLANAGLGNGQSRVDLDFGYVTPAIDLAIAKGDGGASAAPGDALVYTLAYTNAGNYAATGVTITETVPQHTSFRAIVNNAGIADDGAEYSWRDTAAEPGVRYSSRLVEREHDGSVHKYGSAHVTAATAGGAYTVHLPLIRRWLAR